MKDEKQLLHVIELARAEINQQRAPLALRYLDGIRRDVENTGSAILSAEYQLAFSEALAAKNDPSSEAEFQEALQQVSNLPERNAFLEMRVHEHYARDLRQKGRRSNALKHLECAKGLAIELGLFEDSARIQMLHTSLTLEIDNDPRADSLRNLKRAAKDGDFTTREQLAAWSQYCGETEVKQEGLLEARERGSEEYFKDLLILVREEQRDEIAG